MFAIPLGIGVAPHLVTQALEKGRLQLWHKGLEARAGLANEQAQGVQDGCLDLPRKAVAYDADEGTCTMWVKSGALSVGHVALKQSLCFRQCEWPQVCSLSAQRMLSREPPCTPVIWTVKGRSAS